VASTTRASDVAVVLPPYGTDEIAAAVLARLRACHLNVLALSVTADDIARTWHVTARLADSRQIATAYPYSAPDGIHTPREIAEWFVRAAELT
jgi:hypothetical protein